MKQVKMRVKSLLPYRQHCKDVKRWAQTYKLILNKDKIVMPPFMREGCLHHTAYESSHGQRCLDTAAVPLDNHLQIMLTVMNDVYNYQTGKLMQSTFVSGPVVQVWLDKTIKIVKLEIVQGSEIAQVWETLLYRGKVNSIPQEYQIFSHYHAVNLRNKMRSVA